MSLMCLWSLDVLEATTRIAVYNWPNVIIDNVTWWNEHGHESFVTKKKTRDGYNKIVLLFFYFGTKLRRRVRDNLFSVRGAINRTKVGIENINVSTDEKSNGIDNGGNWYGSGRGEEDRYDKFTAIIIKLLGENR